MKKNLINSIVLSALSLTLVTPVVTRADFYSTSKKYGSQAKEFAKKHKGKIAAVAIAAVVAALGFATYKAVASQENAAKVYLEKNNFKFDEMSQVLKKTFTVLFAATNVYMPNEWANQVSKASAALSETGYEQEAQFLLDNKNGIVQAMNDYKNGR